METPTIYYNQGAKYYPKSKEEERMIDDLLAEVKRLREEKKRLHRLFGLAVHHIDALKEIVT